MSKVNGSVRVRANKYNLIHGTTQIPSRGLQNAEHREAAGEDVQSVVIGGNMFVAV